MPRNRWQMLLRQRKWLEWFREFRQFRRLLRSYRFDLALDIQGLLKSGLMAWLSGADERIGLAIHFIVATPYIFAQEGR